METLADSLIDGFILSLSKGTMQSQDFHHIEEVMSQGMPVVLLIVPQIKLIVTKLLLMILRERIRLLII